ncbi:hypothetical protein OF83DRAFT_867889 [Amylostereum chailletii]|nr:hypothetical protein OF83DRAFT_867889 [Amylostereum chailletii]
MSDPLSRQLHPLEVNSSTGELFLRIPAPHSNIIITPPRLSDAPSIVPIQNDPAIYRWLVAPPFPFFEEHATGWLETVKKATDQAWAELQEAAATDAPPCMTSACPVRSIREVKPDGTDEYLGDCEFRKSGFLWVIDKDERAKLIAENEAYVAGDPRTIWSVGCESSLLIVGGEWGR